MRRIRRFNVDDLAAASMGSRVELPASEAHHAQVLRLEAGEEIEVFDASGRTWRARLTADRAAATLEKAASGLPAGAGFRLAMAWPKGKRAATLIEKCTELGVAAFCPVAFRRSVVGKRDSSEGLARLQRIAAEAAKQCGRADVPPIEQERSLAEWLRGASDGVLLLLDPQAENTLAEAASDLGRSVWLIVGPEGGLTDEERDAALQAGARAVRLGRNILRTETACIAACAVLAARLH